MPLKARKKRLSVPVGHIADFKEKKVSKSLLSRLVNIIDKYQYKEKVVNAELRAYKLKEA